MIRMDVIISICKNNTNMIKINITNKFKDIKNLFTNKMKFHLLFYTPETNFPIITFPKGMWHIVNTKCKTLTPDFLNFNKENISLKMTIKIFPKLHIFINEVQITIIKII